MAENLEGITQTILTDVEAAKGIAPYLQVTIPEPPKEWKQIARAMALSDFQERALEMIHTAYLFVTDREEYRRKKKEKEEKEYYSRLSEKREREESGLERYLHSQGLTTPIEKAAYEIIIQADMGLRRCVSHLWGVKRNQEVEVLNGDPSRRYAEETRVDRKLFEEYLPAAICSGAIVLQEKYWMPIKGIPTPEIVNADFESRAGEWLTQEIYRKIETGAECIFVSRTSIRKDGDQIRLRSRYPKERNKTLADQFNEKVTVSST